MIAYLVSRAAAHTIRNYLSFRGRGLAEFITVIQYEDLGDLRVVRGGAAILSSLDLLTPLQVPAVVEIQEQLVGAGVTVLNDPIRSLRRYDLLKLLRRTGRNAFDVHRATDLSGISRFPVFVRDEHLHNGSLTALLRDRAQVEAALRSLMVRGRGPSELLVVEFCDTSAGSGFFRKYSAFRIGEAILPRFLQDSDHWVVKSESTIVAPDKIEAERLYMERNPHAAWLREVFELAHIEYGRIDYGMLDGTPQVWEINTNPTIGRGAGTSHDEHDPYRSLREPVRRGFHERLASELRALCSPENVREVPIDLGETVRRRLRAESRELRRRATIGDWTARIVESAVLQRAKPFLKQAAVVAAPLIARIPRRPS